jgi:hypothetical protein
MLRRVTQLYEFTIHATDGDVGKVQDFFFDDESWAVRYLVVDAGSWLFGRRVLISPMALKRLDWEGEVLPVSLTREQVENSPDIDLDKPVSRQVKENLHEYYGWPPYWRPGVPRVAMGTPAIAERMPGTREGEDMPQEQREAPHLRSTREVIGYSLQATDGELGHVEDFYVSERDWGLKYILVSTGDWSPGRKVLVAPADWIAMASWPKSTIYVGLTREKVKECVQDAGIGAQSNQSRPDERWRLSPRPCLPRLED